jgi:hypothetical protein
MPVSVNTLAFGLCVFLPTLILSPHTCSHFRSMHIHYCFAKYLCCVWYQLTVKGGHAKLFYIPQIVYVWILGFILLSQIRKYLRCVSLLIANLQIFHHRTKEVETHLFKNSAPFRPFHSKSIKKIRPKVFRPIFFLQTGILHTLAFEI